MKHDLIGKVLSFLIKFKDDRKMVICITVICNFNLKIQNWLRQLLPNRQILSDSVIDIYYPYPLCNLTYTFCMYFLFLLFLLVNICFWKCKHSAWAPNFYRKYKLDCKKPLFKKPQSQRTATVVKVFQCCINNKQITVCLQFPFAIVNLPQRLFKK